MNGLPPGANREVEVEGPTVDEAVAEAIAELGLDREGVEVEVVREPDPPAGIPARVRVRARPGERGPSEEQLYGKARELLAGIVERMGFRASVVVGRDSRGAFVAEIQGDVSGRLIGRHGQTLAALEYVLNRALAQRFGGVAYFHVDAGGYRARRRAALRQMAERARRQVQRHGRAVLLEPMTAADRREIHLALSGDRWVITESVGEGEERRVRIAPRPPTSGAKA